jgi:LemA protein
MKRALIALAVIFVIAAGAVNQRNSLMSLDETVNAAWSQVDTQLQRRSDLIPNLVATVQGFAAQEREVLADISSARAQLAGAGSVREAAESYDQLQGALSRLLVVVENYPDLRSNENFIRLQDELAGTENRVAVARGRYNDAVRQFNTRIRQFPGSLVSRSLGLVARDYFEITEEARQVPQVQF